MLNQMTRIAVVACGLAAGAAFAEPEVFSHAGFEADQLAAAEAGKIQVAYFTATWCPPCKKMKAETWVDENVVSWIDANAIITPVDVDQNSQLASRFRARSIPTTVIIVGDEEVARVVGYQSPAKFKDWLDRIRQEHADELRPAVRHNPSDSMEGEGVELADQLDAGQLLHKYNAAVMQDQTGLGLTGSVFLPRLSELVKNDTDLQSILGDRVAELAAKLDAGVPTSRIVREYLQLAPLAGHAEAAVEWVTNQIESPRGKAVLGQHKLLVQQLLTDAGMYEAANDFVGDPVAQARKLISQATRSSRQSLRDLDAVAIEQFKQGQTNLLDRSLADLLTMAQVAGEDAKAAAIANLFGEGSMAQEAINAAAERAGIEPFTIE